MKDISDLDVQRVALAQIADKDTTILATSDSLKIYYVSNTAFDEAKLQVLAYNNINYTASKTTEELSIYPTFEIESLVYSISNKTESYSKVEEGVTEIDVEVANHDSLALIINSNSDKSKYKLNYAWNKEGKELPEDVIYKGNSNKNKCNTIAFKEFSKSEEYDGVYNCIISDEDTKEVLQVVSFNVTSHYPTSNEIISTNNIFEIKNKLLFVNAEEVGTLKIYDIFGKIVYCEDIKGSDFIVDLNKYKGIYLVSFNGKNLKIKL